MKKKITAIILALMLVLCFAACGAKSSSSGVTVTTTGNTGSEESISSQDAVITEKSESSKTTVSTASGGALDTSDLFSTRDLTQEPDLTDAVYYTLKDGENISITKAGVYVLSGSASEVTVTVDSGDDDKVQIVLNNANITNKDFPCIYVKNADKVFITTVNGTENSLSVTGTFTTDGSTNTDAVIFSKDDLVLNGLGTLKVTSSDNGISCKDDLKVTGGTLIISAKDCGLEANDSIRIADGNITVTAKNDAIHAEYDEDQSVGYIYICGGTLMLKAGDDAIHATTIAQFDGGEITISAAEGIEATWVQINGGNIDITSTDDGVNAARKSNAYTVLFEMNDGYLKVSMGQGDTDAIDSNGNIIVNGGTIDITGQSSFDYDGTAKYNGGTIIVNGQTTNTITNQFMGGGGMKGMQNWGGQSQTAPGSSGQAPDTTSGASSKGNSGNQWNGGNMQTRPGKH